MHYPLSVLLFDERALAALPQAISHHIHSYFQIHARPRRGSWRAVKHLFRSVRMRQEFVTVGAFRTQMSAGNRRLRVSFDRDELAVFMKDELPAAHSAIGADRAGHLRAAISRLKISRGIAHRLGPRAVAAIENLAHKRPFHQRICHQYPRIVRTALTRSVSSMVSTHSVAYRLKRVARYKIRGHPLRHLIKMGAKMRVTKFIPICCAFLLATFLPFTGWAQTQNSHPAQPGSINYVEGLASIGNEQLGTSSVGSVQLQAGQTLNTQSGKVEVLLVPGTFLRLDDNSSVKMINPGLANTEVEVERGRALIEGTDINKNNNIEVDQDGAKTKILKNGLYGFNADEHSVRVYKGKAQVLENDKKITLDKERELVLNTMANPRLKILTPRKNKKNSSAGRHCARATCPRPVSIRPGSMSIKDQAGSDPAGIGIPGLIVIRSFQARELRTAHSAGAFTRRSTCIARPSTMGVTTVTAAHTRSAPCIIRTAMGLSRGAASAGRSAVSMAVVSEVAWAVRAAESTAEAAVGDNLLVLGAAISGELQRPVTKHAELPKFSQRVPTHPRRRVGPY